MATKTIQIANSILLDAYILTIYFSVVDVTKHPHPEKHHVHVCKHPYNNIIHVLNLHLILLAAFIQMHEICAHEHKTKSQVMFISWTILWHIYTKWYGAEVMPTYFSNTQSLTYIEQPNYAK